MTTPRYVTGVLRIDLSPAVNATGEIVDRTIILATDEPPRGSNLEVEVNIGRAKWVAPAVLAWLVDRLQHATRVAVTGEFARCVDQVRADLLYPHGPFASSDERLFGP